MLIRDLPPDGVVREAGAYRLTMAQYHSQDICPGPSFSSSGLRTILLKSPADFWAFSEMNPDRFERPVSDALHYGRAAHALILGDEVFDQHFALLDDDAPPRPTSAQTRARAAGRISAAAKVRFDFWDRFEVYAEGKTIIPGTWMEQIAGMSRALADHPLIGPLFDGEPEVSLIWQDEETGLWLKARPDMLPRMGEAKADLKTTADASIRAVMRDIRKHGYDMQEALGCIGCEHVLDMRIQNDVLVFVQKTPPYHVTPVEITPDAIHYASLHLRKAIRCAAECLETGHWPGPTDGIVQFVLTDDEVERMLAQQESGALPHAFHEPKGVTA